MRSEQEREAVSGEQSPRDDAPVVLTPGEGEDETPAVAGKRSVRRRLAVLLAVGVYCTICWVALFHLGSAAIHWAQSSQSALAGTERPEPAPGP